MGWYKSPDSLTDNTFKIPQLHHRSRRRRMRKESSHWGLPIFVLLVSSAALLGRPAWPSLTIWAVLGGVRGDYGDATLALDCAIFGVINVTLYSRTLLDRTYTLWEELGIAGIIAQASLPLVFFAIVLPLVILWLPLSNRTLRGRHAEEKEKKKEIKDAIKGDVRGSTPPAHVKPLIFACRTTHARMFPKRHAFDYSYLLAGYPIFPANLKSVGNHIKHAEDRVQGSWWMQVRAQDYLERGYGDLGFYGKLKKALREQGLKDDEWSYAYLVTAPRFFGYSFNPVSFWYIYDHSNKLTRMILEVNNTFGERRVYLLDGSSSSTLPMLLPMLDQGDMKGERFTDAWVKDFHVSPFNSRKGAYALKACNPFPASGSRDPRIDNTITLKSSKDHAKIVARVYCTKEAIAPSQLGWLGTARFVLSWWWVGLVTFPRILREARKLFFHRSLHVWFRPEVLSTSIGRFPTTTEVNLQWFFENYLRELVQNASESLRVTYYTAIPDHARVEFATPQRPGCDISATPAKQLEIRVLTPAFYARFVHYAHTSEALDRECLFTGEKNRTLWISNPEILQMLLTSSEFTSKSAQMIPIGYFGELRWKALRKLRCAPADPSYPITPKDTEFKIDDIRTLPYSNLDLFVRRTATKRSLGMYRRSVTRLFLAQRLSFGFLEVIDALDLVLRLAFSYVGQRALILWATESVKSGSLGHLEYVHYVSPVIFKGGYHGWISSLGLAIGFCGVHIWALIKGFE